MRARLRAEMTDEIKAIARRHLATEGANLSLRAVARDLGVVSSAIYRYFPSRDDLLTALILDAYNALGASVEATRGRGRPGRLHRPVPRHLPRRAGLGAGQPARVRADLRQPGARATPRRRTRSPRRPGRCTVLGGIFEDAARAGRAARTTTCCRRTWRRRSSGSAPTIAPSVPLGPLSRALGSWLQLFGFVSFELFGQLNNAIDVPGPLFDHQMRAQASVHRAPVALKPAQGLSVSRCFR